MTEYACPSCGAPVRFQSRISVFCVCPFCSQMLVRRDLDVEAVGKMAILPEDSSPLQIGTDGKFDGQHFNLVGRIRQQWSDGYWNEWFVQFDDGRNGWLGEAQGFLMMSFILQPVPDVPPARDLIAGRKITIGKTQYEVEDIKEVLCVGSQGELPFQAWKGRKSTSVDVVGDQGAYACLDYSQDGVRVYAGKYVEFEALGLKNLRQIDGW